jgi:hypothetical protein
VMWMATKGTRWFLRRSVDLIPYMLFMAAREALAESREWPAESREWPQAPVAPVAPVPSWLAAQAGEAHAAEPLTE